MMKRITEIIVKDVLLTEAKERYPYAEDVAQFLASLTSELSRCVSIVGFLSLGCDSRHCSRISESCKQWQETVI